MRGFHEKDVFLRLSFVSTPICVQPLPALLWCALPCHPTCTRYEVLHSFTEDPVLIRSKKQFCTAVIEFFGLAVFSTPVGESERRIASLESKNGRDRGKKNCSLIRTAAKTCPYTAYSPRATHAVRYAVGCLFFIPD